MECNICKGEKKLMSYNSWDIESGYVECSNCKGTGVLTDQQELDYTLLNMETHEAYKIDDGSFVLRVIGGWIYNYYLQETGETTSSVFVKDYRC